MVLPYTLKSVLANGPVSLGKTTITTTNDTEVFLDSFYKYDANGRPVVEARIYTDALSADVDTTGSLNAYIDFLGLGSLIKGVASESGSQAAGNYRVTSNDGTDIDLANISSIGLANTD